MSSATESQARGTTRETLAPSIHSTSAILYGVVVDISNRCLQKNHTQAYERQTAVPTCLREALQRIQGNRAKNLQARSTIISSGTRTPRAAEGNTDNRGNDTCAQAAKRASFMSFKEPSVVLLHLRTVPHARRSV